MPSPSHIEREINETIRYLIRTGLSVDQQEAYVNSPTPSFAEVTFPNALHVKTVDRVEDYVGSYVELLRARSFNVKMIDGALIQMMYEYRNGSIAKHRLSFYSSPNVEQFQNAETLYLEDEIDLDVIENFVTPFVFRFDFDSTIDTETRMPHPSSHFTMADYENCRIAVSGPLTPCLFLNFVIANFYDTAEHNYSSGMPRFNARFANTVRDEEMDAIHIVLPR